MRMMANAILEQSVLACARVCVYVCAAVYVCVCVRVCVCVCVSPGLYRWTAAYTY